MSIRESELRLASIVLKDQSKNPSALYWEGPYGKFKRKRFFKRAGAGSDEKIIMGIKWFRVGWKDGLTA